MRHDPDLLKHRRERRIAFLFYFAVTLAAITFTVTAIARLMKDTL